MSEFTIKEDMIADDIAAAQATPEDTSAVMSLLVQTAEWLRSKGSSQWSGLLEGEDTHNMTGAIANGDVFVFKQGDQIAGVIMMLQQPSEWDCSLWGEEGHESSIYLHRLAIHRAYSGRRLGAAMMRWVDQGISFAGKDRLRLDCIASNDALNAFYQSIGYEYKGSHSSGFNIYEKTTSPM
ncbi:GNAT family N-acetyltransferase [Paenibacillus profundus]|uniref:GNAT family N-acetyltransferase n=1 Tax=Paenibacillus profundus TaxID=1173085 RepID=A0ABS8Y9T2_9BACL|nr:GNAT family N-acetyltransferase [Paenibacillus profundus]MCE5168618.1 GNAT family N-acetyltransferase [Paenibacillus profundus]